ncbi:hypothetical protein BO82DRAFT_119306 [Aspergillus uvarum CBS 121591]|uniref:Uncharacterized protein n=1 Tax=Aspergillus uvarum CBS 121591 TaxID=1448315 RepID=A0A319C7Y6_9EURO|nr:hypothetical protein BO82DRAFT_119306 [Aspergillus uvarum CBS 121591]PYH79999.1 hypothetical protein BO82DRAFT_119306 [Aspergillus uvarum CBS 121591]
MTCGLQHKTDTLQQDIRQLGKNSHTKTPSLSLASKSPSHIDNQTNELVWGNKFWTSHTARIHNSVPIHLASPRWDAGTMQVLVTQQPDFQPNDFDNVAPGRSELRLCGVLLLILGGGGRIIDTSITNHYGRVPFPSQLNINENRLYSGQRKKTRRGRGGASNPPSSPPACPSRAHWQGLERTQLFI